MIDYETKSKLEFILKFDKHTLNTNIFLDINEYYEKHKEFTYSQKDKIEKIIYDIKQLLSIRPSEMTHPSSVCVSEIFMPENSPIILLSTTSSYSRPSS